MKTKPLTRGGFSSREDLVADVLRRWKNPRSSVNGISLALGVSWPTVKRILVSEGAYKQQEARPAPAEVLG